MGRKRERSQAGQEIEISLAEEFGLTIEKINVFLSKYFGHKNRCTGVSSFSVISVLSCCCDPRIIWYFAVLGINAFADKLNQFVNEDNNETHQS